ncbi:MAG TPA: hypothetical protein VEF34_17030 [Syntrophobacteraceae bacterium]|nr:hypothetical protein [Syntrophobacteraceae bacterium]
MNKARTSGLFVTSVIALFVVAGLLLGFGGGVANATGLVYELDTAAVGVGDTKPMIINTPSAANGGDFSVPKGKYAYIDSVVIFPQNPGTGTIYVTLLQGTSIRDAWVVPNNVPTQFYFPDGLAVLGGSKGTTLSIKNGSTSSGPVQVLMNVFGEW